MFVLGGVQGKIRSPPTPNSPLHHCKCFSHDACLGRDRSSRRVHRYQCKGAGCHFGGYGFGNAVLRHFFGHRLRFHLEQSERISRAAKRINPLPGTGAGLQRPSAPSGWNTSESVLPRWRRRGTNLPFWVVLQRRCVSGPDGHLVFHQPAGHNSRGLRGYIHRKLFLFHWCRARAGGNGARHRHGSGILRAREAQSPERFPSESLKHRARRSSSRRPEITQTPRRSGISSPSSTARRI